MLYTIEFINNEDKEKIIKNNIDKFLLEEKYLINGNFLVFSDIPTSEILIEEQGNKISILTEENEKLKQELALTQDAVNEILFMMMNMEGK